MPIDTTRVFTPPHPNLSRVLKALERPCTVCSPGVCNHETDLRDLTVTEALEVLCTNGLFPETWIESKDRVWHNDGVGAIAEVLEVSKSWEQGILVTFLVKDTESRRKFIREATGLNWSEFSGASGPRGYEIKLSLDLDPGIQVKWMSLIGSKVSLGPNGEVNIVRGTVSKEPGSLKSLVSFVSDLPGVRCVENILRESIRNLKTIRWVMRTPAEITKEIQERRIFVIDSLSIPDGFSPQVPGPVSEYDRKSLKTWSDPLYTKRNFSVEDLSDEEYGVIAEYINTNSYRIQPEAFQNREISADGSFGKYSESHMAAARLVKNGSLADKKTELKRLILDSGNPSVLGSAMGLNADDIRRAERESKEEIRQMARDNPFMEISTIPPRPWVPMSWDIPLGTPWTTSNSSPVARPGVSVDAPTPLQSTLDRIIQCSLSGNEIETVRVMADLDKQTDAGITSRVVESIMSYGYLLLECDNDKGPLMAYPPRI